MIENYMLTKSFRFSISQEDDQKSAVNAFREDTITGKTLLLNIESRFGGIPAVTLVDQATNEDIGKALLADGFLIYNKGRDRRLVQLVSILNLLATCLSLFEFLIDYQFQKNVCQYLIHSFLKTSAIFSSTNSKHSFLAR